ncbi:hypothetical protein TNCV_3170541 [Trichonephila clavipes]|nr:hypothetical protein TNCV_3170541 [Trichonephila clavipes]
MCKAVMQYSGHKLLSVIDIPDEAGKVSKTNALNVRRLPTPLKTSKRVSQLILLRILNDDQSADEIKSASLVELKDMAKKKFRNDLYKPWQK